VFGARNFLSRHDYEEIGKKGDEMRAKIKATNPEIKSYGLLGWPFKADRVPKFIMENEDLIKKL